MLEEQLLLARQDGDGTFTGNGSYESLADRRIRLLGMKIDRSPDIYQGTTGSPLSVQLRTISLDQLPGEYEYMAISYVWGDSLLTENITCDGQPKMITTSLHEVLSAISHCVLTGKIPVPDSKELLLWVDGLCINQDNCMEKASQVKHMGEIYRKASSVLAYLGAPSIGEPRDAVLGMISWLSSQPVRNRIELPADDPIHSELQNWQWTATTPSVISSFWCSPWFLRAWVTQEAVLASDLKVIFGSDQKCAIWPWNTIDTIVKNYFNQPLAVPGVETSTLLQQTFTACINQPPVWNIIKQALLEPSGAISLARALALTSLTKVTLEKDRVYAVLSLVPTQTRECITVDYSDDFIHEQLLADVAMHCIDTGSTMEMLQHAGSRTIAPELPSWVPEWVLTDYSTMLMSLYKCCNDEEVEAHVDYDLQLHMNGFVLSRVHMCGPGITWTEAKLTGPWRRHGHPAIQGQTASIFLERATDALCQHLIRTRGAYPTEENAEDVVWRTLSTDRGLSGERSSKADRDAYNAYRSIINPLYRNPTASDQQSSSSESGLEAIKSRAWQELDNILAANVSREQLDTITQSSFFACVYTAMQGRKVIASENGYLGVAPNDAREGDFIVAFKGAQVPWILREDDDGGYEVIGNCYVHGLMDGEAFLESNAAHFNLETAEFVLR